MSGDDRKGASVGKGERKERGKGKGERGKVGASLSLFPLPFSPCLLSPDAYNIPITTDLARYRRKYATIGVISITPIGGTTLRSGSISHSVNPYTTRIGFE
jgi:hypothetical protein